ncbi:Cof-type HAD-IIB family hydrolase [Mycetocola tolaasinivorans]|uniref:Cof-type HAD-IIB family hydrolase n=1 Tax=Mycetocola tolaasinivorans TaxID=76635 RepID=UPI0016017BE4|nr:Cof-type HAD-IIB family hydrolase [Mycetocola tolaasinivorans]
MLSSYPLLVSDLDGTLLTDQKSVSPETTAALRAAREQGMALAIASARPYRLIRAVIPEETLALFSAVIVSNGAAILSPDGTRVLHSDALGVAELATLITRLRALFPDAGFGWESGTEFGSDQQMLELVAAGGVLRDPHADRVKHLPTASAHQLVMAPAHGIPRDHLDTVRRELGEAYAVTDSLGGVVEISPVSVTKADAARVWAASLGHTLAEVVAFGDEHNDLPLLRTAGLGVAMGNAAAEVRETAHLVTATNNDHGVARTLWALLSGEAS